MTSSGSQRVVALRNLIAHPSTGAGERAAAQRALDRILEKASVQSASSDGVYGARHDRGGRHASLARIADMICEDIILARAAGSGRGARSRVAVLDPVGDIPAEVRIVVEAPFDAGISISVDNVPPDWGWVLDGGVQSISPAFTALVDALADIMNSYNHGGDGIAKRFFGSVRSSGEMLAW